MMRIGQLAGRAGCPVETIRYYEKEGLMPPAGRSSGNYRVYGAQHAERLSFIRRCRSLDMSLPEIRELLEAVERPEADCAPVNALLDAHIGHVTTRIAELTKLRHELQAVRSRCKGVEPAKGCGILVSLARPVPKAAASRPHVGGTHGGRKAALR